MPTLEEGIEINVNWLYSVAGNDPGTRLVAWKAPVHYGLGLIPGIRAHFGARDCLFIAVTYEFLHLHDAAFEWLLAGQAHNTEAQDGFKQNKNYTLKYALDNYIAQAAAWWGFEYANYNKANAEDIISRVYSEAARRPGGLFPAPPVERPDPPEPRGPIRGFKSLSDYDYGFDSNGEIHIHIHLYQQ